MKKAFWGFVCAIIFFALFIYFDGGRFVIFLAHKMELLGERLVEVTNSIKQLIKP